MDLIAFFNSIADHLLTQNEACVTKRGKPQTFRKNLKDPVGFLLPKKQWKKDIDKHGIYFEGLPNLLNLSQEQTEIVMEFQAIHDIIIPEKWPEWIEIMRGRRFNESDLGDLEELEDELDDELEI